MNKLTVIYVIASLVVFVMLGVTLDKSNWISWLLKVLSIVCAIFAAYLVFAGKLIG